MRAEVTGLPVPAASEIVLEGWIHPGDVRPEGPFGEFTGYSLGAREREIVKIKAITHRNGAGVVAAGAQFLAVIHDLWAGEGADGMERARALSACFH